MTMMPYKVVDEVFKAYKALVDVDLCYQVDAKNAQMTIPYIGTAVIVNKDSPTYDTFLSLSDDMKESLAEINSKDTQYFVKQLDKVISNVR